MLVKEKLVANGKHGRNWVDYFRKYVILGLTNNKEDLNGKT